MFSPLKLSKKSAGEIALTQENKYNENGQRISRSEAGNTRSYYYDGGAVLCIRDGKEISTANILGPQGTVVGSYRDDKYSSYIKDVQGSTSSIVGEDGKLNAAYTYTDFGETSEITGSGFDNEICYTGAIYDESTGLYYMNVRYYDPANGRFISQDSYRGEMNDPGQWHLYAYCANNPINYTDPSGHIPRPNDLYKTWHRFGFNWNSEWGIFYTRKYCPQYNFGYCNTYDRIASGMKFDIHSVRSEFYYGNKWWRIQFWKGRYGATNGGEFGIYTSTKSKTGWHRCAAPNDMLKMTISLTYESTKKTLFRRSSGSGTHWWLNGFKPGIKLNKDNLRLRGSITFKNRDMADKFRAATPRKGFSTVKESSASRRVSFSWRYKY